MGCPPPKEVRLLPGFSKTRAARGQRTMDADAPSRRSWYISSLNMNQEPTDVLEKAQTGLMEEPQKKKKPEFRAGIMHREENLRIKRPSVR